MKKASGEHNKGELSIEKTPIVAVVGPTACGKSILGIEICKHYNGEVISADSMQIYKKINIASAKLTIEEMQGIPHYLIDQIEPDETFNVFQYCSLAHACIKDISSRGKLPVLVGGTGLYIDSLLNGIRFPETDTDANVRMQLKKRSQEEGPETLLEELRKIDPQTAARLHPNDLGRIIRALELYYTTGIPASSHKRSSIAADAPYLPVIIGLNFRNRQTLYQNINIRIDKMLEKGLLDEAKMLHDANKTGTGLHAIGIKELFSFFESKEELPVCIEKIKQETRRYAKRQMTWFRRNDDVQWIYVDDFINQNSIAQTAFEIIEKNGLFGG